MAVMLDGDGLCSCVVVVMFVGSDGVTTESVTEVTARLEFSTEKSRFMISTKISRKFVGLIRQPLFMA